MTIESLLNKARKAAEDKVWSYYLDICDGDVEETKEWIEHERAAGVIDRDIKNWTMDNIHDLIRTIKSTALMNDEEKKAAVAEIKRCPEYQQTEKEIAVMFADHFVRYQEAYLR